MVSHGVYETSLGTLIIGWEQDAVVSLKLGDSNAFAHRPSPVSDLAAQQLRAYLAGDRRELDFPVALSGTDFQIAVWKALRNIPYGETRTYGQIASLIGRPKAARAVGMACNKNPLWIRIPCHRVLGKDRTLTGYAGGLQVKQYLLELERHNA